MVKIVKCINGHENMEGDNFCRYCGERLSGGQIICEGCGAAIDGGSNFCGKCGKPVVEIKPGGMDVMLWQRGPEDFATRFDADDLSSTLKKGIIVEQGTKALLFLNGALAEILQSGRYDLGGFANKLKDFEPYRTATAILMDSGDAEFHFSITDVATSDPLNIGVTCSFVLQIDNHVLFFNNVMKGRQSYLLSQLRGALYDELQNAFNEAVERTSVIELSRDLSLKHQFEISVENHLKTTFQPNGFSFVQFKTTDYRFEQYDKIRGIRQEIYLLVSEDEAQIQRRKRLFDVCSQTQLQDIIEEAKAQQTVRRGELEADIAEMNAGLDGLERIKKIKVQQEREEMEIEAERLQRLSALGIEALTTASGETQATLLADLQKTELLKGMTEEQILAMGSTNSSELAKAFQEKFRGLSSEQREKLYRDMMSQKDKSMQMMQEMFNKALETQRDATMDVAQREGVANPPHFSGHQETEGVGEVEVYHLSYDPGVGEVIICPRCKSRALSGRNNCGNCGMTLLETEIAESANKPLDDQSLWIGDVGMIRDSTIQSETYSDSHNCTVINIDSRVDLSERLEQEHVRVSQDRQLSGVEPEPPQQASRIPFPTLSLPDLYLLQRLKRLFSKTRKDSKRTEMEKGIAISESLSDSLPLSRRTKLMDTSDKDPVDCTVFSVPEIVKGEPLFVPVFAHLVEKAKEAEQMAQEFNADAGRRGFTSLETEIERGSQLTFELQIRDCLVDDPIQTIIWKGRTSYVSFEVKVPKEYEGSQVVGKVIVSQQRVPIGRILFNVKVYEHQLRTERLTSQEPTGISKNYRYAFISYASQDRSEVLRRVQMLKPLGIDFFQDLLNLEPGTRWEKELYKQIDLADVFYLFWSSHASNSEWVRKEIKYAVQHKQGYDGAPPDIIPVIIEGPPVPKPPEELEHLHFNDKLLYFMGN